MRGHLDGASTKLASVTSKLSIPTKPPTAAASANVKMIGLGHGKIIKKNPATPYEH